MTRRVSAFPAALAFPVLVAAVAWLLGALLLPAGWKGVQQTMTLFAFFMAVSWSVLSFFSAPPVST